MAKRDHSKYPHPVNHFCLRPFIPEEVSECADVSAYLKRSPTTAHQYAHRYGIGRCIGGKTAFSKVATKMFAEGDFDALGLYLRGDRSDPKVTAYYRALDIEIPATVSAGA